MCSRTRRILSLLLASPHFGVLQINASDALLFSFYCIWNCSFSKKRKSKTVIPCLYVDFINFMTNEILLFNTSFVLKTNYKADRICTIPSGTLLYIFVGSHSILHRTEGLVCLKPHFMLSILVFSHPLQVCVRMSLEREHR